MDKPLVVIREHDPIERVFMGYKVAKTIIG